MKVKSIYIIVFVLIVLTICVIAIFNTRKADNILQENTELKITSFNIEDRTSHIKDNVIYLGNSIKEIENDFYDLKIVNNDGVNIYLNKLWYESYGEDYIQDEYLAKICREIVDRLNISTAKEELEYMLYKYVKDNYVQVREGKTIPEILVEDLEVSLTLSDSMAKLKIKRGV